MSSSSPKPPCRYGSNCYRRNPMHFIEFDHPGEVLARFTNLESDTSQDDNIPAQSSSRPLEEEDDNAQASSSKRIKLSPDMNANANVSKRFGFYLSKVHGINDRFNSNNNLSSIGIKDILDESKGKLLMSAQFNYMFDIEWLLDQYPAKWRKCPVFLVFGTKNSNDLAGMREEARPFSQITLCPVKLIDAYSTHHTKMMFLHFEEGLQIVIHTANMISGDWHQKTQGVWVSPMFPLLNARNDICETNFKADLLEYLKQYKSSQLKTWIELIEKHDFSSANVFLVASVPGRHKDAYRSSFGHMKLRKILSGTYGPNEGIVKWPVISQFSSIGSLGADPTKWLTGQFLCSMAAFSSSQISLAKPDLKCIFPSVENVRTSLEGYRAGGSLPYSSKVASRQPYLKKFMHQWKASWIGRSEASPHIKTYCRISPDWQQIAWFLLTSANLSKAAWGELQVNGSQLAIRAFEIGVVFLPKILCDADSFTVQSNNSDQTNAFPLPYDTPLSVYASTDEPWTWDRFYIEQPDRNGNIWTPGE